MTSGIWVNTHIHYVLSPKLFLFCCSKICVFFTPWPANKAQTNRAWTAFYWQRLLCHYFCKLVAQFQLTCRNIWVANIWYILGRRYAAFRGIWKLETIKPWVCGLIWLLFHSEQGPGGSNDVTVRLVRARPINHIQQHCRCSVSLKLTIPQRSSCKGGSTRHLLAPPLPVGSIHALDEKYQVL